jgi:hypothetical protein
MQEIVSKAFISELTARHEKYKRLSWRGNMNHSSTVGISFSYIMPVRGSMNKKKLSFYKS